eukprot:1156315-Pelagomonas_calceolata.AAC.6
MGTTEVASGQLEVSLCQGNDEGNKTICTAYDYGGKTCPEKALAYTFEKDSARNIMALVHHV